MRHDATGRPPVHSVGEGGFEPPTSCPQSRCATAAPLPVVPTRLQFASTELGGWRGNVTEVSSESERARLPESEPGMRTGFRPDIEGLRAVAVLLVVLYHGGIGRVTGGFVGVDVFFVISGFLITGQLTKVVSATGAAALPAFYARRIKRLLPVAATVTVATVLAYRLWGLPTQQRNVVIDAFYTTFYGLTYRLAESGTQYFNSVAGTSPFQHFWSLGVEEQFYAVWPLLILGVVVFATRRPRRALAAALVVIGIVSVYLSSTLTRDSPGWAYFGLHTRAWELALGALVSVTAHRWARLPRAIADPASWLGMAGILAAAFAYNGRTPYPGVAVALPVVGTAIIIGAGCAATTYGAERALSFRPAQAIGRLSYSWYMWHWPLLVIAPLAAGRALGVRARGAIVLASLLAAVVSYYVVERPFRRRTWPTARWFATAGALAAVVFLVGGLVLARPPAYAGPGPAASPLLPTLGVDLPAATDTIRRTTQQGLSLIAAPSNLDPDVASAPSDGPSDGSTCFLDFFGTKQEACAFGDVNARRTVVLIGDSHVHQWLPAFDELGRTRHWRVVLWSKAACPVADITLFNFLLGRTYTSCDTWRQATLARIAAMRPELVIASQRDSGAGPGTSATTWAEATVKTLRTIAADGSKVAFTLDSPSPGQPVPDCIGLHLADVRVCNTQLRVGFGDPAKRAAVAAAVAAAGFEIIDPTPFMCDGVRCPVIVGNAIAYRDSNHVTATYARFLAPMFEPFLPAEPGRAA